MKKNLNLIKCSLLLILIFSIFNIITISKAMPSETQAYLVSDSNKVDEMPSNFRKTTNLDNLKARKLNIFGLENLNISGSQQFSGHNIGMLINEINNPNPIYVIDLRQESHGFINDISVSYANQNNNANFGLSRDEVIKKENSDLASIKLNETIILHNNPNQSIIPTKVENEESLVKAHNLSYIRVPVTDGGIPTDDMVDYFVDEIDKLPKDHWIHFHCKAGEGRTTTFMIMYDMLKNSKNVSKDDIINRQLHLTEFKDNFLNTFHNPERDSFLTKFYTFSRARLLSKDIKWSDFK